MLLYAGQERAGPTHTERESEWGGRETHVWSPEGVYILPPKGESEDRTTISCYGLDFIAKLIPSQYLLFELNKAIFVVICYWIVCSEKLLHVIRTLLRIIYTFYTREHCFKAVSKVGVKACFCSGSDKANTRERETACWRDGLSLEMRMKLQLFVSVRWLVKKVL